MFILALNAILGWDPPKSLSRIGKRKYSRHLKRKLMSQQICVTLLSSNHCLWNALPWLMLFSSFALCTKRTKQLQISINYDMKYLQKKNVSEGRLPPTFSRRVNCQTFV